jgi:nitrate reductase delta subunit
MLLRSGKRSSQHFAAVDRLTDWTRRRFKLAEDAVILVSEVSCTAPGCPPIETVVAFWTEDAQRHHFKLFKRVTEVAESDLPPSWMKSALIAIDGSELQCC